jgi:hypothetical protein
MRYAEFTNIMSPARMGRYRAASSGDSRKAMTLYRKNLLLSQELFTLISCFEVALRNSIDRHYSGILGTDWLRNAAAPGGIFDNPRCRVSAQTIKDEVIGLSSQYTHAKLVAELGFGFWRYLFSPNQYRAGGQTLLKVFASRPLSSPVAQYNASFIFNELAKINGLRNRIAHHEPICFIPSRPIKDTTYARQHYHLILQLFQWMSIEEGPLLYGLDHILILCNEIDAL